MEPVCDTRVAASRLIWSPWTSANQAQAFASSMRFAQVPDYLDEAVPLGVVDAACRGGCCKAARAATWLYRFAAMSVRPG